MALQDIREHTVTRSTGVHTCTKFENMVTQRISAITPAFSCENSGSHGGEYEVQNILGCTVMF
jgi:hypothetical protein